MTIEVECAADRCSNLFIKNGRGKYCSDACKTAQSRSSAPMTESERDSAEAFETARDLANTYYLTAGNEQRNDFIRRVIISAMHSPRIRRSITAPKLVKPDRKNERLFPRRCPESYCTIAQIANNYCMKHFGKPIHQIVKTNISFEGRPMLDMSLLDTPFAWKSKDQPKPTPNSILVPISDPSEMSKYYAIAGQVIEFYDAETGEIFEQQHTDSAEQPAISTEEQEREEPAEVLAEVQAEEQDDLNQYEAAFADWGVEPQEPAYVPKPTHVPSPARARAYVNLDFEDDDLDCYLPPKSQLAGIYDSSAQMGSRQAGFR